MKVNDAENDFIGAGLGIDRSTLHHDRQVNKMFKQANAFL
jgi:hypothetical protein